MNKKEVFKFTKIKVYKSMHLPTQLHWCESWELSEELTKKMANGRYEVYAELLDLREWGTEETTTTTKSLLCG